MRKNRKAIKVLEEGCALAYILLAVISWAIFLLLVDKRRLREYYPTYFLTATLGFFLDVFFGMGLHAYAYTDPIGNAMATVLMEVFAVPVYGVLFQQYLPVERFATMLYILGWSAFMLIMEAAYLYTGKLTFYKWHFVYSTMVYILTFSLIARLANWHRRGLAGKAA